MLRTVVAVVAGYLAIVVAVVASFAIAGIVLGPDQIFKPGSYQPSLRWIGVSFFLGFWAASLGGVVCAAINQRMSTVRILALLVVLAGVLFALPTLRERPDPGPRAAGPVDVAASSAAQPAWVAFTNAPVGAAGVWFGGWALLRKLGRRAGKI